MDTIKTNTEMTTGTPAYMAPEMANGEPIDRRADLYALGCVAFWMLTGRPAFEAADVMTLLRHHAATPPMRPSLVAEEPVPAELDALVLECLAKDPRDRPADAEKLWEGLDKVPLTRPWHQRRAREWWERHDPDARPKEPLPPRGNSGKVRPKS